MVTRMNTVGMMSRNRTMMYRIRGLLVSDFRREVLTEGDGGEAVGDTVVLMLGTRTIGT
jgi:hypothetical protein